MTTATFFASATNQGYVQSGSLTPTSAQDGANLIADTTNVLCVVGQDLNVNYYAWESFLEFDTSAIPDDATITGATVSVWISTDNSATDFTIEVRSFDFGTSVTTADFRNRAQLGAATLLASRSTSGLTVGAYNDLTSDANLLTTISMTGTTRVVLCSSRQRAGTTAAGQEYVYISSPLASGTTQDPKLTVTYSVPVAATLAAPLGGLSGSATATPDHPATLAAPLGGLSGTLAATPEHAASLDAPLGALTAAATATVTPGAATVDAVLDAPLGALTATASAGVEHGATLAAALGSLTATATAGVDHPATLAAPLGSLTASATADVEDSATFSAPLGGLTASAAATVDHPATLAAPLGGLTATATATVEVAAVAQAALGGLIAAAVATVERSASLDAPLGSLSASASASIAHAAVLSAVLGGLDAHAEAVAQALLPETVWLQRRSTVLAGAGSTALSGVGSTALDGRTSHDF